MLKQVDIEVLEKEYREHNERRVRTGYFLGSMGGVFGKEGELWRGSVGFSDLGGTKHIDGKTLFRMASMTKPITAVAILQMAEQGRITPDTPIAVFLPEYERMRIAHGISGGRVLGSHAADTLITPRHLLSHSSGLGCGTVGEAQSKYIKKTMSLADSVRAYADSCLDFEPETSVKYSGLWAFDVLARLVELLADMPYEEYIKKFIFEPLGMVDTTYLPTNGQRARCVDFLERSPVGLLPRKISGKAGFVGFEDGMVGGGAGLFSTFDDYCRFAQMLLHEGYFEGAQILSPFSVKQMAENQEIFTDAGRMENPFGLGVRVCGEPSEFQPLPKGSFGWSGTFGTHFWVDPENGLACIYLMNLANGGGSNEEASKEFERDVMGALA